MEFKNEAIHRFESYIQADPQNSLLRINLGDLYHEAGRFDDAIACYEKVPLHDENNRVAHGRVANVMISLHRFAEAEHLLTELIQANDNDPALLHNLGLSLYYQQRWQDALQNFERARQAGLELSDNLAYIVYSLHQTGDTGKALQYAEQWQQASPGPNTEGYLAMLEMDHGNMLAAVSRAEKVVQQQPDNTDAAVVLGTWQIEQQDINQAIAHFGNVVRIEPDSPRGWQGLGLTYMYQQNFPKAIEALEKACALSLKDGTSLVVLGWAKLANRDAEAAEQTFLQAIKSDRNFGEAHGGLAAALVIQNKQDAARETIKIAMRLDPENFGAIFANSVLLQLRGKSEQGTRMLAKMLEHAPRPDGKPLIKYIQTFLQQQGACGPSPQQEKRHR